MLRTVWFQTCARDGSLLQSLEALKVLQLALSLCARKPDNAYICRSLLCLAEEQVQPGELACIAAIVAAGTPWLKE